MATWLTDSMELESACVLLTITKKILPSTKQLFYVLVYLQFIVTTWCIVNKRTSCKVGGEYCKEQFPLLMIYIVWPFVLLHIHYDMIFSPERLWCMRKWSNRCTCNYFAGINKSTKFGFKFNNWNLVLFNPSC